MVAHAHFDSYKDAEVVFREVAEDPGVQLHPYLMEGKAELEVPTPPTDGISSIRFGPDPEKALVASWDACLRIYRCDSGELLAQKELSLALLDACYAGSTGYCIGGGLDRSVFAWHPEAGTVDVLGTHDHAVRNVSFLDSVGLVVSGSWDKTLRTWDLRAASRLLTTTYLQDRVHALSISQPRGYIVLATANKELLVYDFRNLQEPMVRKDSPLKYQTRCLDSMPNGEGYALGSIEGRVGLEYFDNYQARKYAFKCHRTEAAGTTFIYMVNGIGFHPEFGTFATGGSDGVVYVWDGINKKRLWKLRQYPAPISAVQFSPHGRYLVIGSSSLYEEGVTDPMPKDGLYIRTVEDADVQPKAKN